MAFDLGCFLAQFRNQLFGHPHLLERLPESIFLEAYLDEGPPVGDEFLWQVELFRARTNLSIAAFLIRVVWAKARISGGCWWRRSRV